MRITRSNIFAISLIIILAVLTTLVLQSIHFFSRVESASFDHRVGLFRSDHPIHEDVVIILIDEESLQSMAGELGRWPWPRTAYRDLLDFFALAGAQTFAFDILFTEQQDAGEENLMDQVLIDATRQAGNTVHAMQLLFSPEGKHKSALPKEFERLHAVEFDNFEGQDYNDFLLPIEALYKVSRDIGYLEIEPDRDGVYRRIRLFNQLNRQQVFPALSSAIVLPLVAENNRISYDNNTALMGDLKIPLDGNGSYLINPYGQVVSYSAARVFAAMKQITAGETENLVLDPKDFAGKIIFLGASAIGLLDVKATALASKEAGVFLHAYTVSNLLQQDFLHMQKYNQTVVIMIILCLVSSISVVLIPRILLASIFPITLAAVYFIVAYSAFAFNQVYPVTPIIFAILLSMLLAYSYRAYLEKYSKQKIRKMLGQYVSPGILAAVIDTQEDLRAEIGTTESLTILFSDIRSFTDISESMEARKVVGLLNIYFSEMTDIIFEYNGTLDKFIGDAIMAFWGAPIKTLDHAIQATKSAIRMRERIYVVNKKLVDKGYPNIEFGIGIHSGEVILGNIGSEKKLDYTVIGDSVNLASRLEGLTKTYGCSIIISEDTWDAIQKEIPCILIDWVRVKGKHQPIKLYSPVSLFQKENNLAVSSDEFQDLIDKGFILYLRQDWKKAEKIYGQIGNCVLSELFRDRCRQYELHSPGEEWDGVYLFKSK